MKKKRSEKECSILFKRMEKNRKNGTFFYKERKRTERTERSFVKNGKERKERNVLLQRTDAFLNHHTSKIIFKTCFPNLTKMPKDTTKMKARYENSTFKLVLKGVKTLQKMTSLN